MDKLLASMPALIVLGLLTFCELLAMCIPVIDELVDGCMVFVVPFISIISTLGTWGLYIPGALDNNSNATDTAGRMLEENSFGDDLSIDIGFAQIFALVTGVGVALAVHLIKMMLRLFGEGWLTNILAILEIIIVTFSVLVVVFIQYVAILFAAFLLTAMVWYFSKGRRKANKKKREQEEAKNQQQRSAPEIPEANQADNQEVNEEVPKEVNEKVPKEDMQEDAKYAAPV